ncbi:MAG: polysaccharide export protein [Enhydrobacter sp.]|nr:MAG: polysaccharide export protein [Enhydrobacter sp.]
MAVFLAGCSDRTTTGIYALPLAPETVPQVGVPPQVGPTNAPDRECKQQQTEYKLGSGDKIRVVVLSDPQFSGDYEVNSAGTINARMLGNMSVTGSTTADLEEQLKSRYLSAGFLTDPRISVELVSYRPFFIIGEVSRPGSFQYLSCLRVVQAVAVAGGYTRRASRARITIRRFFSNFAEEEYVTEDTLVEPGDVVRVPERYF